MPIHHRQLTTFAMYALDRDARAAENTLRPFMAFYLSLMPKNPLTDAYGIGDELAELAQGVTERIAAEMPDQWLGDLAIAGDQEECAAKIRCLLDAGSDSAALFPMPVERAEEVVRLTGAEVLARL